MREPASFEPFVPRRLARNVAFVANLMDSDTEFVACDNPHASRLVLHILAAPRLRGGQALARPSAR